MNKFFAALGIVLLAHGSAQADIVKTDFTTMYGSTAPVTSLATLTLTLNGNGTIAAALDPVNLNQVWYGISIDSTTHFKETAISQGIETSWGTSFGNFMTGLYCDYCMGSTTWTIGDVGQFTSVKQVFSGTDSSYDAFFYTGEQYGGMLTSDVPEPASVALLCLGLAGAAVARRRGRTPA